MKKTRQKFVHYAFVAFTYGVGLGTAYMIGFALVTIVKENI